MLFDFTVGKAAEKEVRTGGKDPRNGIGEVEHERCWESGEDGVDPHDAEQAGAHERDDHWRERFSKSAHDAASNLHQTAQKVGHTHDRKADHSRINHGGAVGEDRKQGSAKQKRETAHREPHDRYHAGTEQDRPFYTV